MATTKVSALAALTTTDGAEELLINDGGTSKKVTIDNMLHDDSIRSEHYVAGSIDLEHMSSESVDEDNLHISNAGSNGQFLSKQSGDAGGLTWATPTSASTATASATGVIKIEDDTDQSVTANTVSTTAGRTYGLQLNSSDQGVVNVPWTDTDTNTNQLTTFTVSATTDTNATTISQGDDLMFTAGTGIACETTADGTVTITNTVTDTNTMGSGFTVSATTDTNATTITQGDDLLFTAGTGITCETTADGTVTITNVIADNAVGLAQMAGGTDGNIISYDSSGNPVAIATGNDGQILTSAGAGAQPAFEDAPQGVSNSKLFYYGSFT